MLNRYQTELMNLFKAICFIVFMATPLTLLSNASADSACDSPLELESVNPKIKCISLIDDDLSFPRNLISLNGELWVVDKGTDLFTGGYYKGVLYRYRPSENGYTREIVVDELLDPNDIAHRKNKGGQYWVYVTTSTDVFRLRADLDNVDEIAQSKQTLVENIPTYGWHKLIAIEINQHSLWVTVPSASDHCELAGNNNVVQYPCEEADNSNVNKATSLIRRYDFDDNDQLKPGFVIAARGLRDALAVAVNPYSDSQKPQLVVADNGWDQIDLNELGLNWQESPADELNVIDYISNDQSPKHYGWPYCYDNDQVTPPYQAHIDSCGAYAKPWLLLPAHTAPLTMIYYQDTVLVNLHATRPEAGRTIMFKLNPKGLPIGQYETVIDWAYIDTQGQRGRPLGIAAGANNEIYVTDDWHHRLIKIVLK